MRKLVVASNNINKIREIKDILKELPLEILSLSEAGIKIEIEENGNSFLQNAYIKAEKISNMLSNVMVLADDSGLAVDSLDGAPGIYSARFSGEHGNSKKNNEKLLNMLQDKNSCDRNASFICAMVLISENGDIIKVEEKIDGIIIDEERGTNGFGYDPIFYLETYKQTFAEMESDLKNKISHRAKALAKLRQELEGLIRRSSIVNWGN